MEFALTGLSLPLRIRPSVPMTDEELMLFCAKNEFMAIERDADGEILVMTPAGGGTGRKNMSIIRRLDEWSEQDARGLAFDSNTGFVLPDGSMRSPDAAWASYEQWNALSPDARERFAPICPEFIIELRSRPTRCRTCSGRWKCGCATVRSSPG